MEWTLKTKHGLELVIQGEGIVLIENAGASLYGLTIDPDFMAKICRITEECFRYQKADFDASEMIRAAFDKLPNAIKDTLLAEINADYGFLLKAS